MVNPLMNVHGRFVNKVTEWASQNTAVLHFAVKTVSYFLIILALVYLYDYCGVNGAHFIYNEF